MGISIQRLCSARTPRSDRAGKADPCVSDRVVNANRCLVTRCPIMDARDSYLPVMGKRRSCCPHIPGLHGSVWREHGIPWRLPGQPSGDADNPLLPSTGTSTHNNAKIINREF